MAQETLPPPGGTDLGLAWLRRSLDSRVKPTRDVTCLNDDLVVGHVMAFLLHALSFSVASSNYVLVILPSPLTWPNFNATRFILRARN